MVHCETIDEGTPRARERAQERYKAQRVRLAKEIPSTLALLALETRRIFLKPKEKTAMVATAENDANTNIAPAAKSPAKERKKGKTGRPLLPPLPWDCPR